MSAPLPDADADVSASSSTARLSSHEPRDTRAMTVRENRVWVRVGCAGRDLVVSARVGTHRAAVRAAGGDVRVERRDASGRRVGHDSCGSGGGEARRFVTTERIDELTIIKRDTKACLFCFLRIVSPSSRSHRNCFSPNTDISARARRIRARSLKRTQSAPRELLARATLSAYT